MANGADVPCCSTKFWLFGMVIVGLVAFAGLMAGLTLGLMSLGLVDLEVLIKSGRPQDRVHAAKIFPVVKNQHLLLCTLLIGNSMAMESLPIFLDKLVPPWAAILVSVTLILMFGEILPQAICSRYGMMVGAALAPFVRILLLLFFPVAYPISKEEAHLSKESNSQKPQIPEVTPEARKKASKAKARGDEAFKRKDFLMAVDAYTQAIDLDPSDGTLLSNRSLCWIWLEQADHALDDAKACRALRPDWAKACYREGAALRLLQRFDEAANAFYEGVKLDPENKGLVDAFREAVEAGRKFHGTDQQKSEK